MTEIDTIIAQAPAGFDPQQYAVDSGWSWDEIDATARLGVADEDKRILTEEHDDAGQAAIACLYEYCRAMVTEDDDDETAEAVLSADDDSNDEPETDWPRVDAMRDEDIDLSDSPELTPEMFRED